MLSSAQENIKDKIKEIFNGDKFNIVYLSGATGSGKTFLVDNYLKEIENYEDWKGYYIEGNSDDVSAYSTIIQAESINSPGTEVTGRSLNIGFNILKIFNIGLNTTSRKKEIFDSKIDFFINMLRKTTESNILIIADSFEFWDESSKTLITAIINHKKILAHKTVKLLIIANEHDSSKVLNLSARTLLSSVKQLKLFLPKDTDEIKEIITLLGYNLVLTNDESETIMSLSGANIDFIKIVIEALYTDGFLEINKSEADLNLSNILEHRMKIFGSREADAKDVLKASSIINGEFNTNEIRFLCNENNDVDNLLYESYTHLFLKKGRKFSFSNNIIREFFYKKVTGTQARFHLQYSKYLQKNRPENYFSRALHLSLADEEEQETKEIFGLFALSYCRNMEISANGEHQLRIEETLNHYLNNKSHSFKKDFKHLSRACNYYLSQNYKDSYEELNQISTAHSLLFRSEVLRVKLLVSIMLDLDTLRIERDTKALCFVLDDIGSDEAEQWAQCNFALFSTYTNKLGQFKRGKEIVDNLQNFISKQNNRPFFEYLGRVLDRKTFLFNSAEMSIGPMGDSVVYFKETDDYLQYYFSLCNYGGILIVLNQFEKASLHLEGCLRLIEEHSYIKFPSIEKVYNNLILARFLSVFRDGKSINDQFLNESIMNFREKIHYAPTEKDAVMLINLANLYLINKDYQNYNRTADILKNTILLNNVDSFYEYHLTNLELAKSILQYNWREAENLLIGLKDTIPDFHTKNEEKIINRLLALEIMIKRKIVLEPVELDQWVYENSNPKDASSSFHCRFFLFSDLQFSSL